MKFTRPHDDENEENEIIAGFQESMNFLDDVMIGTPEFEALAKARCQTVYQYNPSMYTGDTDEVRNLVKFDWCNFFNP
jgi:hypothetical protein